MNMNEENGKRGMDLKRFVLCVQSKIWVLLMLTVVGAALGGVAYQMARAMRMPIAYQGISKLYISFGVDESGEVYQYYNGYTWNDLLDADPILDKIMENVPVGYSREEVIASTTAEILSDIRLLTITVEGSTEKYVREIQSAVQNGLIAYARESEELRRIEVIRTTEPARIFWDDRTVTACIAGAVVFAVVSCFIILFVYVLDEAVYVQSDIESKYPYKALGMLTRSQKGLQPYARELKANAVYVLGDTKKFGLIDMENHSSMRKPEIERLLNVDDYEYIGGDGEAGGLTWSIPKPKEKNKPSEWEAVPFDENGLSEEDCALIRELGGTVILIPFGEDVSRRTQQVLSLLRNQDCNVLGIIIAQADEDFLERYYG